MTNRSAAALARSVKMACRRSCFNNSVAEGRWNEAGTEFDSEKLLVKHDADYEDYDEENPERLDGDESNDT